MRQNSRLNKFLSLTAQIDKIIIILLGLLLVAHWATGFPLSFFHYDDKYFDFIDQHTDLDSLKDYSKKLIMRSNIANERFGLFTTITYGGYLVIAIILGINVMCIRHVKKSIGIPGNSSN